MPGKTLHKTYIVYVCVFDQESGVYCIVLSTLDTRTYMYIDHCTLLRVCWSAGLQYAEEVGVENDPNPGYRCTLCSVSVDGGNQALHFTSTAHRMNVLVR